MSIEPDVNTTWFNRLKEVKADTEVLTWLKEIADVIRDNTEVINTLRVAMTTQSEALQALKQQSTYVCAKLAKLSNTNQLDDMVMVESAPLVIPDVPNSTLPYIPHIDITRMQVLSKKLKEHLLDAYIDTYYEIPKPNSDQPS